MKKSTKTKIAIVESTASLIYELGVENISIRKISSKSGYNLSNIYTYFGNLNNLLIVSSFRILDDYYYKLKTLLSNDLSYYDMYFSIWDLFLEFYLSYPDVFKLLFLNDDEFSKNLEMFYELFPESKKVNESSIYKKMMSTTNLYKRNFYLLELLKDNYVFIDLEKLNRITVGYALGLMNDKRISKDKKNIYLEDIKCLFDNFTKNIKNPN